MSPSMVLTHEQAQELVHRRLQGRLEAFEQESLAAHLAECPACAAQAAQAATLDRQLAESLPARWPERRYATAEVERRLASIQNRARRESMFRRASTFAQFAGAAVLLIALIAGLAWLSRGTAPRPISGGVTTATPAATAGQETPSCVYPRYQAQPGDTVLTIAQKYGVSLAALQAANHLAPDNTSISAGQVLIIPDCGAVPPPVVTATAAPPDAPQEYTVQDGDTCAGIAYTFNVSVQSILDMNGLPADCATLRLGQILRIPRPTETPAAQSRVPLKEAEALVRAWIFANQPDMNPESTFPLEEFSKPAGIFERVGVQVFKVTDGVRLNESFAIRGEQVQPIGEAFGGQGIQSMAVTDLDGNGSAELLFTYQFGSGISQSSLGILWVEGGQMRAQASGYLRYRGALALSIEDDQNVSLTGAPDGGTGVERLGKINFIGGQLVVTPGNIGLATYAGERYGGLSFLYPAGWQPVEPGADSAERYAGEGGGFELSTRPAGFADDLSRACEWEANNNPARYGSAPSLSYAQLDGQREACQITAGGQAAGGASDASWRSALLFPGEPGQVVLLTITPAYLPVVVQSARFTSALPTEELAAVDMTPAAPGAGKVETTDLGPLALREYRVVDVGVDTPGHFEFNQRIPDAVLGRRTAALQAAAGENLVEANRQLEPFGYRLEAQGTTFTLYKGRLEVVKGEINFFSPVSAYRDEAGGGDFALVVEDNQGQYLVQKDSLKPWDVALHRFTRPVYAGSRLMTLEREDSTGAGQADGIVIKQDGQPIFHYALAFSPVREAVKSLDAWNGDWVLEVNGTLIVGGSNWNQKELGADEIFGWMTLGGKPFFFFRKDGAVHAWYDGQTLPGQWDEIVHYNCCEPAAFNPAESPHAVFFYARKNGAWWFEEVGEK